MLVTAENVARQHQLTTEQQHELVLHRQDQYQTALEDDCAFLKRFMTLPFDAPAPNFKKTAKTLAGDEGVTISTPEGLAKLKPVLPDGTMTFGCQTHPADANAGIIVAGSDRARELSRKPKIQVRLLGFGMDRVEAAYMPAAPAPAAKKALAQAGVAVSQLDAIKLHNPFTANDFAFASGLGVEVKRINNYGCSLLWGHPQAPMVPWDHGIDRGAGYPRRRLRSVQRLRGWRQCDAGRPSRGRPALGSSTWLLGLRPHAMRRGLQLQGRSDTRCQL